MMVNIEQLLHPATLISAVTLVTYLVVFVILFRQSTTREHFAFVFYLGTMVIWSLGSFMTRALLVGPPLLWNEIQIVGIMALPLATYNFAGAYLHRKRALEAALLTLTYAVVVVLSFTGQIISSVMVMGGKLNVEIGSAGILGGVWWLGLFAFSLFLLIRGHRTSPDEFERRRLKFLLANFGIIILGVFTNFTALTVYPVDIAANSFAALVLGYAIYRHQFLDFRFALRSSLIYLIPTTLIASGYFLVISITTRLVGTAEGSGFFFVSFLTAVAAALIIQPLRARAQYLVDLAFYRNTYNEATLLETISAITSTIVDLVPLSEMIVQETAAAMKMDQVAVMVYNRALRQFEIMAFSNDRPGIAQLTIDKRHPVSRYLSEVKAILSIADFDIIPQLAGISQQDHENLKAFQIKYLIPLKSDKMLIGLLALGNKRSEAPLDQRDQHTLLTIANQISVAIERAQNYETAQASLNREQMLHDITKTISQDIELDLVLDRLVSQASKAINTDGGLVLFIDQETQHFTIENNLDLPLSFVEQFRLSKIRIAEDAVKYGRSIIKNEPEESYLAIPLISSKVAFGAVVLFRTRPDDPFTEGDQLFAESIARQAGVAIQKARLFEETKIALLRERKLNDLAKLLNKGFDTTDLMRRLAGQSASVLQANCAVLALANADEVRNNQVIYHNLPVDIEVGHPSDFDDYWLGFTRLKNPVTSHHPDHPHTPAELVACGTHSLLAVPFSVDANIKGSLSLIRLKLGQPFTQRDVEVATAIANQASSSIRNAILFTELEDAYLQTVTALANAIDARDQYTNGHSQRIAMLAEQTAWEMGISGDELVNIHWAAKLHDIGKIGVPDHILNKPGPLTDEEWEIMRMHPEVGADIIDPVKKLGLAAPMIRGHHEKWNGHGYPDGLAGDNIPLGARILAVVDAFVAMTDDRVYRASRPYLEALLEMEACSGSHFDPAVVDVLLNKVLRKPEIMQQFQNRSTVRTHLTLVN